MHPYFSWQTRPDYSGLTFSTGWTRYQLWPKIVTSNAFYKVILFPVFTLISFMWLLQTLYMFSTPVGKGAVRVDSIFLSPLGVVFLAEAVALITIVACVIRIVRRKRQELTIMRLTRR